MALLHLSFSLLASLPQEPTSTRHDFALPLGVRATYWHVPAAEQAVAYAYLPLSLVEDPEHRSQYSHLMEHLLLHSHRSEEGDPIQVQAETTESSLRIGALFPISHWRHALDRLRKWATLPRFAAEILAEQKQSIALEEEHAIAHRAGHKLAIAAWNQVIGWGLTEATLRADLAGASVESAEDYCNQNLYRFERLRLALAGPMDPALVQAFLSQQLEAVEIPALARATPPLGPVRASPGQAEWDLPTPYLLTWYRLPDDSHVHRIAAALVSQLVWNRIARQPFLNAVGAQCAIYAPLRRGAESFLLISVALPEDASPETVKKALQASVGRALEIPQGVEPLLAQTALQSMQQLDLVAVARQLEAQLGDKALAQVVRQRFESELSLEMTAEEFSAQLLQLTAEQIETFHRGLVEQQPESLLLHPPLPDGH